MGSNIAGILTWLTYSMVKMTHNLPCRELPFSSLLLSSFNVFIMILSPSSEFIARLFPFLNPNTFLSSLSCYILELPGALYRHFHISLCKCSFSQALTSVSHSDVIGLARLWIGFGWTGFGWSGSSSSLDWIRPL